MNKINHIYRLLCGITFFALSATCSADTIASIPAADTIKATPRETAVGGSALTHKDSLALKTIGKIKVKRDWTTWKPDPKRAMWLAIMVPGAGQIYNRKYWKLPIVYGGFLGCAYAMRWNNMMYNDYSQAYLDIMDDDPTTKSYTQFLHLGAEITPANEERYKSIFKSRKDRYRRWRDMSFFCMLGVYALSIIDAYVDASLSSFDISDDLSLHLEPAVINGSTRSLGSGTSLHNSAVGVHGALIF